LNHVVFEAASAPELNRRLLAAAGFQARDLTRFAIDLPPLYDDE